MKTTLTALAILGTLAASLAALFILIMALGIMDASRPLILTAITAWCLASMYAVLETATTAHRRIK